jgi:preprotein translocase subunit SecE
VSDEKGAKGKAGKPENSRPVTAAARRQRRSSAQSADSAKKAPATPAKAEGKSTATPKRGRRKDKKPSVFARMVRFIREVLAELRKVIWPTRKQMITYTTVVLVFVAFMIALVSGLDFVFRKGVFWLFG